MQLLGTSDLIWRSCPAIHLAGKQNTKRKTWSFSRDLINFGCKPKNTFYFGRSDFLFWKICFKKVESTKLDFSLFSSAMHCKEVPSFLTPFHFSLHVVLRMNACKQDLALYFNS